MIIKDFYKPHGKKIKLAVACAADKEVMTSSLSAYREGLLEPIFYGDAKWIESYLSAESLAYVFEIIDGDETDSVKAAVSAVRENKAQLLMKGHVQTSTLMRAVLNRESGIRDKHLLSHVGIFELPLKEELHLLTDAALNIAPTLEQKVDLIKNAARVGTALGLRNNVVGCLCAVEQVNEHMPATVDAQKLSQMDFANCLVSGPLALDNALFSDLASHKGIKDPAAGRCNILLAPNIEAGNLLYKSLAFVANCKMAGIVVGARAPIILTSRSDNAETKLNSIALGAYLSQALS